jgi:hypothetical protein
MGPTAISSKALGNSLYYSGPIRTSADAIHAVEVALVGASASAYWPAAASGSPLKPLAEDAGSLTCAPTDR